MYGTFLPSYFIVGTVGNGTLALKLAFAAANDKAA